MATVQQGLWDSVLIDEIVFVTFIVTFLATFTVGRLDGRGDTPLSLAGREGSEGLVDARAWLGVVVLKAEVPGQAGTGADGTKLVHYIARDEVYVVVLETD